MTKKRSTQPVDAEELAEAMLRMILEKFDGRKLGWETVAEATVLLNERVKMAALRAAGRSATKPPPQR